MYDYQRAYDDNGKHYRRDKRITVKAQNKVARESYKVMCLSPIVIWNPN